MCGRNSVRRYYACGHRWPLNRRFGGSEALCQPLYEGRSTQLVLRDLGSMGLLPNDDRTAHFEVTAFLNVRSDSNPILSSISV